MSDLLDPAVRIERYDERWAVAAADEVRSLRIGLGGVADSVEHIGSTAVPGLAAKPILDFLVTVVAIEPASVYVVPLERLGYLFVPNPDVADRRFFAKPAERPRSHHVHVCEAGSDTEFRHLALRDFLRAHGDEAAAYEREKRGAASRHPNDRLGYIAAKHDHVQALEVRAVEWARATPLA